MNQTNHNESRQFYLTMERDCPYLEGKKERKIFTSLQMAGADRLHERLAQKGFRRSQSVAYRPACKDCAACLSVRIRIDDFIPSKSQKRIIARNRHLVREVRLPHASEEQYELFQPYVQSRHEHGGMAEMDIFDYADMVESSTVPTRLIEYRDKRQNHNPLVATSLTDIMDDGLSLVYSFFDVASPRQSYGSFIILDHIEIAKSLGFPYLYLGYWVKNSPKMGYKARFSPLEYFGASSWEPLDERTVDSDAHKLAPNEILESLRL